MNSNGGSRSIEHHVVTRVRVLSSFDFGLGPNKPRALRPPAPPVSLSINPIRKSLCYSLIASWTDPPRCRHDAPGRADETRKPHGPIPWGFFTLPSWSAISGPIVFRP